MWQVPLPVESFIPSQTFLSFLRVRIAKLVWIWKLSWYANCHIKISHNYHSSVLIPKTMETVALTLPNDTTLQYSFYIVATPNHKIPLIATSQPQWYCYESYCKYVICRIFDIWPLWKGHLTPKGFATLRLRSTTLKHDLRYKFVIKNKGIFQVSFFQIHRCHPLHLHPRPEVTARGDVFIDGDITAKLA